MGESGITPPFDPQATEAEAGAEEAKRQAEQQGSSVLGNMVEVAAGAVDLIGTVVEGVAAAVGGLLDI